MMRPVLKIWMGFFFVNLIATSTLAQSLSEQLNPAFKAYQDGQFDLAKEQFQKVLEANSDNSFILYNLGLAEYKLGNIGLAIGIWNKALNHNPALKEARSAINFALSKLEPKPEEPEVDSMIDVVRYKMLPGVSVHAIFFLCALVLFLFWRRLIRDLVVRKQSLKDKMVPPPFATFTFVWATLFVLLAAYSGFKVYEDHLTKGIVTAKKIEAKTGPNSEQVTLFTMNEGTQVVIKEKEDNWYKIESPRLKLGWVPVENIFVTTDN